MLTPRNVKILGGRVSDLEETCSLAQQLTDVLGRDNVDPLLAESRVARPRPVQNGAMTGSGDAVFDDAEDELFMMVDDPSINSTNSNPGYVENSGYSINVRLLIKSLNFVIRLTNMYSDNGFFVHLTDLFA